MQPWIQIPGLEPILCMSYCTTLTKDCHSRVGASKHIKYKLSRNNNTYGAYAYMVTVKSLRCSHDRSK